MDTRPHTLPVLVFDGDCGFCTTAAGWMARLVGEAQVEAWQFLDLADLRLSEQRCRQAVQWAGADGTVASGAAAVAAALRHAGGAWRWLGRLIDAPVVRGLAALGYGLVARNRYRLPGGTPACRMPGGAAAGDTTIKR